MNLSRGLLLFALGPICALGQSAAATATKLDAATEQALVKLGGQLMVAGKAYDYDRTLADDIGPRLTGSDNYMKAAAWAADTLPGPQRRGTGGTRQRLGVHEWATPT